MLVQGSPTGTILRQEMMLLLRVPLKACGQIVFSQMTDRLLVSGLSVASEGAEDPVSSLGQLSGTRSWYFMASKVQSMATGQ